MRQIWTKSFKGYALSQERISTARDIAGIINLSTPFFHTIEEGKNNFLRGDKMKFKKREMVITVTYRDID